MLGATPSSPAGRLVIRLSFFLALALAEDEGGLPLVPPPQDYSAVSFDTAAAAAAAPSNTLPLGVPSAAVCDAMISEGVAWASCNGLLMRKADGTASFDHAPFSLLPAEFPAEQLEIATELAPLFGTLVDRIADDVPWLTRTLQGTADSDDFTRRLLKLCAKVQREGATQGARLAVLRSDYMLHDAEDGSAARLLQVELNTIAASFGCLSTRVSQLHTHLAQRFAALRRQLWLRAGKPSRLRLDETLPPNAALAGIAEGLARAHAAYGAAEAVVLFVVQPDERNGLDQELLRQRLWSEYGVRVVSRTLLQLAHEARLEGGKRVLRLGADEVAVAYLRAGYSPDDHPTNRQWDARLLLERSHAIKAPCIEHQLVGCKKVQQQLSQPGELERFVSPQEAERLRAVFAGLWSLSGAASPDAAAAPDEHAAALHMRLARERPDGYVMKPQREGGGHNFFGDELRAALGSMTRDQRSAFILMQRIFPRAEAAVLVRGGAPTTGPAVSELGVYSTYLRAHSGRVLLNRATGHLVRTKLLGTDEGGVNAGFAVLSSPIAVRGC